MRLIELVLNVDEKGMLVIPTGITRKMGFAPEEEATITYVTESTAQGIAENSYRDFYIGKTGLDELPIDEIDEDDFQIRLSAELLEDANISPDADLEVVCQDGRIVIMPVEDISEYVPQGVYDMCEELGISKEKVDVVLRTEGLVTK